MIAGPQKVLYIIAFYNFSCNYIGVLATIKDALVCCFGWLLWLAGYLIILYTYLQSDTSQHNLLLGVHGDRDSRF